MLTIDHRTIGIFQPKDMATTCRLVGPMLPSEYNNLTAEASQGVGSTYNTRQHCSLSTCTHNQCRKNNPAIAKLTGGSDKNEPTSKSHGEHEAPKVLIIPRHPKQQRIDEHCFLTLMLWFKLALDTTSSSADVEQRLPQMRASCPRRSGH